LKPSAPQWGDIIWIDFSPKRGHEQSGQRPALVISNSRYNTATDLVVVCPITSQVKGYPTEVPLPALKTKGVVLASQVRTLDWKERGFRFQEQAPRDFVNKVIELVTTIFEEPEPLEDEA
jgi:mRNA interferase MazF